MNEIFGSFFIEQRTEDNIFDELELEFCELSIDERTTRRRIDLQIYSAWIQWAGMSTFGTIHVMFPYSVSMSGSSLYKYVKFIVIWNDWNLN